MEPVRTRIRESLSLLSFLFVVRPTLVVAYRVKGAAPLAEK